MQPEFQLVAWRLPLAKSAINKMCLVDDKSNTQYFHYVSCWHDLAERVSPTIAWHKEKKNASQKLLDVLRYPTNSTNSILGLFLLLLSMSHTGTQRGRFDYTKGRMRKPRNSRVVANAGKPYTTHSSVAWRMQIISWNFQIPLPHHGHGHRYNFFPSGRAIFQMLA